MVKCRGLDRQLNRYIGPKAHAPMRELLGLFENKRINHQVSLSDRKSN